MISNLEVHSAARIFPMLSDPELDDLAKDIKAHGLLSPITLVDGRVLDGRNRLRACEMAGVEPHFVKWDGQGSPIEWVISANLKRRHLNASQLAMIGAEVKPLLAAEARVRQLSTLQKGSAPVRAILPERETGRARDQAAQLAGVSARYVQDATALIAAAPELAEKVRSGELTLPQAKRMVAKKTAVAAVQAYVFPTGSYGVIVADPPWPYENAERFADEGSPRGIVSYPTMTIGEIKATEIPAAEDAILWLWTTNAFMAEAHEVARAWGFETKTILTWIKPKLGLGHWLRNRTEHCLLAVRGNPVVCLTNQSTVLEAPAREHSRKPGAFYQLVEDLCPARPLIELFAREERAGWITSGAEVLAHAPASETHAIGDTT